MFRLPSRGKPPVRPPAEQRGDDIVSTTLTPPPPTTAQLNADDRCDRCGARAQVRAILPTGGDLVFCRHHANKFGESLRQIAVEIIDTSGTREWHADQPL
jgi:hypothetical protein